MINDKEMMMLMTMMIVSMIMMIINHDIVVVIVMIMIVMLKSIKMDQINKQTDRQMRQIGIDRQRKKDEEIDDKKIEYTYREYKYFGKRIKFHPVIEH